MMISQCAKEVARIADQLIDAQSGDHGELHQAMMQYRAASVAYLADPLVSDYVRANACRYDGKTHEAIERIADLIDQLNRP